MFKSSAVMNVKPTTSLNLLQFGDVAGHVEMLICRHLISIVAQIPRDLTPLPGTQAAPFSAQNDDAQLLAQEERALRKGLVMMKEVCGKKSNVPITLNNWKKATESIRKAIWNEMASGFHIDEKKKDYVFGRVGRVLRLAFLIKRKNCERVKNNEYPYYGGRTGQNKEGNINNPHMLEIVSRMSEVSFLGTRMSWKRCWVLTTMVF
ncbi:hypothetical protein K1719_032773 [Acacia pycnantha]|nr:hypothetical protein K1719_032773 [Acacia pycnantha]